MALGSSGKRTAFALAGTETERALQDKLRITRRYERDCKSPVLNRKIIRVRLRTTVAALRLKRGERI